MEERAVRYTFQEGQGWSSYSSNSQNVSGVNVGNESGESTAEQSSSNSPKVSSGSATKNTSKGKADKEFRENEIITLTGDLEIVPGPKTISILTGDTVMLYGLGKYLSGQYFITGITRKVDNSAGYSHSHKVQKTGFGGTSLKGEVVIDPPGTPTETERPEEVEKTVDKVSEE